MTERPVAADRWAIAHGLRAELHAHVRRQGLTHEEAEDVVSEAVLRAGSKPDLDPERAAAWLRVVARNLAVDAYRSRPTATFVTRLGVCTHDRSTIPQEAVDDRLEADWVATVIDTLPARQQAVLRSRAEGLSTDEIAALLEESYKAVESLMSRARSRVRQTLAATFATVGLALSNRHVLRPPAQGVALAAIPLAALALLFEASPPAPSEATGMPPPPIVTSADGSKASRSGNHQDSPHERPGRSPKSPAPSTTTRTLLPPREIGPIHHGGVTSTRSREDESLRATVQRCLNEGPRVSLSYIGCT